MKQGTVWVLTFSIILFGVLLGFGLYMPANSGGLISAGVIFLLFGIGVSLPDIIPLIKRTKRARDIRLGKIDPTKKLSHYKGRRRSASRSFIYTGEDEDALEDQLRKQALAEQELANEGQTAVLNADAEKTEVLGESNDNLGHAKA